jgi:uncharacterized membrane protein
MTEPTLTGAKAPATTRSPFEILGWAAPLVGLLVAVYFLTQTQWYGVFKTIHVLAAITWLGGGLLITILAIRADRAKNDEDLMGIGRQAEWASTRIFIPAGLIVLVMGVILMHKGHWGYDHFWTLFGLIGFAASFVIGATFLGPQTGKLNKLAEEKGPQHPETQAALRRIIAVARADVVLIVLVAVDMVAKPFFT